MLTYEELLAREVAHNAEQNRRFSATYDDWLMSGPGGPHDDPIWVSFSCDYCNTTCSEEDGRYVCSTCERQVCCVGWNKEGWQEDENGIYCCNCQTISCYGCKLPIIRAGTPEWETGQCLSCELVEEVYYERKVA